MATDSSAADAADIEWSAPTLQERRAIIYCARKELEALTELLEILDSAASARVTVGKHAG